MNYTREERKFSPDTKKTSTERKKNESGDFTMKDLYETKPKTTDLAPKGKKEFGLEKNVLPHDKKILAPESKNLAPSNKILAPDNKNLAPDYKGPAPDNKTWAADKKNLAGDKNLLAPDKNVLAPDKVLTKSNFEAKNSASESRFLSEHKESSVLAPDSKQSSNKSSGNTLAPSPKTGNFNDPSLLAPSSKHSGLSTIEENKRNASNSPTYNPLSPKTEILEKKTGKNEEKLKKKEEKLKKKEEKLKKKEEKRGKKEEKKEDSKEFTAEDLKPKPENSIKKSDFKDLKPKLKSAISADTKHAMQESTTISENLQKRKEEAKKAQREYQTKLKEIKDRVNQRPLLVESATDASNKNKSKMKILLQIKKSLVDSGLKIEGYFNEEEMDLIQEAEYMSKMNRLNPK